VESLENITVHKARFMLERVQVDVPLVPLPETILKVVPAPYLPPLTEEKYTLVLDLDETLIHYMEIGNEGRLFVRPYCQNFLQEMSKYYEVVIFTAALQDYADWALDQIDTGKWITHRLYRQHTMPSGTVFLKDLSRLGRDLTKTIIADNVAENFSLQNDNGIFVKTWFDDPNDVMLESLAPLLREIVVRKVKDVRAALRNYRDQFLRQIIQGVQNPLSNLSLKR
jgi:CTD small phosphatase-like protein 2